MTTWKWVTSTEDEGMFLVDKKDRIILECKDFYSPDYLDLIQAAPEMQKTLSEIVKVLKFYVRHEQKLGVDTQHDLLQSACSALASAAGWD